LCDHNKEIQGQLADYYKEASEIKGKIESASKQNNDYKSQASSLAEEQKTLINKNEILNKEKTQLQNQLEKSIKDNTSLENSIKNLEKQINFLTQEKNELSLFMKNKLENLETQIENQSDLQSQLSISNQTLEDYKIQLNNLSQQIPEYMSMINKQNDEILEWETKYQMLLDENNILKENVADLENKNKQMFENLEKDLAQKAKEYKQRTIQMLNTPNKSMSPFMKHSVNIGHNRGKSEDQIIDNIKIEDLSNSPKFERTTQNFVVAQNLKDSITPTSEDIRSKIATLMKNRMKIEEKIQNLGQE
jgi:chromosome segregation ATPase